MIRVIRGEMEANVSGKSLIKLVQGQCGIMPYKPVSIVQFSLHVPLQPFYLLFYRVKGMLMINVLAVVAGLLMGLCRMWKPHIMVISGRAVMGLYCGTVKHIKTF